MATDREARETDNEPTLSGGLTRSVHDTSPSAAHDPALAPGSMLSGRFRIVSLLGRGGMGAVYRADDVKLGQAVALKFVHGELSPERRQRLLNEVRIGRQVSHPNVCRLYDIVEHDHHTFLAMEYVDGEDLASLVARIGKLPKDKADEIARELCSGLAAVHERGIVHRDLKPANVMIDGRGRARLTDFGLAIALESGGAAGGAGTPAYMAPEQLAGQEATIRSDIYSLGLLLFEMYTGRRYFDAKTLAELREQHGRIDKGLPSESLRLLDASAAPAIEQAIDEDPARRPPTARALLSLLPGGVDPLDAAVAAGETPSPELVAASGETGEVGAARAWGTLAATAVLYVIAALATERTTLLATIPLDKPPEALVERAHAILEREGHSKGADSAYSYDTDLAFLAHVRQSNPPPARWVQLASRRPGPYNFFYRQSPQPLVAANRDGVVTRADPPQDVPGMAEVVLDARGRLLSYANVPPRMEETPANLPTPDWEPLFRDAGLDSRTLTPVAPHWTAPFDSDQKLAWTGSYADGEPVRVEAAAYHGRAVWFALIAPWTESTRGTGVESGSATPFTQVGLVLVALAVPLFGLVLARHNLRLGRSDRRGAERVAAFVFVSYSLARLVRASHASSAGDEVWLVIKLLAYPALWAGVVWLLYVALEPQARRRWPRMLVAWKRLLSGQLFNPLVGRDVALGVACGLVALMIFHLPYLVAGWLDRPFSPFAFIQGQTLTFERQALFRLFVNQYSAVQYGLLFLFLLVLLRSALRSMPLVTIVWCVLAAAPAPGSEGVALAWGFGLVRAALILLVMLRVGLLGFVTMLFVTYGLAEVPLPLGFSDWHYPRAMPMLLTCAALAIYGFRTSLAGKSPLGRALLGD